jgi:hypothetical protein
MVFNPTFNNIITTNAVSSNSLSRGVPDMILYDKVCQWLATGRRFSLGTLVSSTHKTDRHAITEILLKVGLNTITLTLYFLFIHTWIQLYICHKMSFSVSISTFKNCPVWRISHIISYQVPLDWVNSNSQH